MDNEIVTNGIIVKLADIGESDRMMTILTPELGKISVIGKGVKNIKSHRLYTSQLFCYSEFTLSKKKDIFYLKEAILIEDFYSLREDLSSLYLALYLTDVVSTVTITGEDQGEILRLLLNCLYLLANKKRSTHIVKAVFELRLACLLGFMPDLSECSCCHAKDGIFWFNMPDGIIVCDNCRKSEKINFEGAHPHKLDSNLLKTMRYICEASEKKIFSFAISEETETNLSAVCEKYLLTHLDRGFDSLDFYKKAEIIYK
jgi:DNA repair protein RecO (recombination protein O)